MLCTCMYYVCMCVCMYVCIICMYYVCMYVCMYLCVICRYVCTMYVCMYVRMYKHVSMYVCVYVCIYVCTIYLNQILMTSSSLISSDKNLILTQKQVQSSLRKMRSSS